MAVGRDGRSFSFLAGENLKGKKGYLAYVKDGMAYLGVPGRHCFPILVDGSKGQPISLAVEGSAKVRSAGCKQSDAFTCDTDGRAKEALAGDIVCGVALEDGPNESVIEGFSHLTPTQGVHWGSANEDLTGKERYLATINPNGSIDLAQTTGDFPLYPIIHGAAANQPVAVKTFGIGEVIASNSLTSVFPGDRITTDGLARGHITITDNQSVAGFALEAGARLQVLKYVIAPFRH